MSSENQHSIFSISMDNYEEYFLLYIDQELSATEREAVEKFIEAHPELEDDLNQLQLTKCSPEQVPVFDKSILFKNHIDSSNIESLQMMLIDDELDAPGTSSLEEYMKEHPVWQENLRILQQTKLPDERIIYPHKNELLKNKTATIISIRWTSVAIAASLIIFMGLSLSIFRRNFKEQKIESFTAAKENKQSPGILVKVNGKNNSNKEVVSTAEKNNALASFTSKNEIPQIGSSKRFSSQSDNKQHSIQFTVGSAKRTIRSDNKNEQLIAQTINISTESETSKEIAATVKTNNLPVRESFANENNGIPTRTDDVAANTEYIKDNYATEALNNVQYVTYTDEDNEPERKGLKIFIRKANRIYNKVTHPEPDKTIFRFAKTEIGIPR